jgi:hypothetical protein
MRVATEVKEINADVEEMLQLIEMLWRRVQLSTAVVLSGDWSNEDEKIAEKIQEIRGNHTRIIGKQEYNLVAGSDEHV